MRSFRGWIYEQALPHPDLKRAPNSPAPRGVVFLNQGKTAIVGVEHANNPHIEDNLKERIRNIADIHGKYYEGDGGDVAPLAKDWGNISTYDGGWDNDHMATYEKTEPYHLIGMFGNGNPKYIDNLTNPKTTIFNHFLNNPHLANYILDKGFDAKTLTTFLKQAGVAKNPKESVDLLSMAHQPATRENVQRFISAGMNLAFPTGPGPDGREAWLSYPNPAGQMANKISIERNLSIMNKPGVFFAGAGHLDQIMDLAKERNQPYELHGGELSQF